MNGWSVKRIADDDREGLEAVRELFAEYHEWLGEVVCSRRLAEEIAALPGPYAAPSGGLFLATTAEGDPVGCIAVRPHEGARCEIKRLYVRETWRGTGLGSALVSAAIDAAVALGYEEALVTTLPESMPVAAAMYERLGFSAVEPFLDHSHVSEGVEMLYLGLRLR